MRKFLSLIAAVGLMSVSTVSNTMAMPMDPGSILSSARDMAPTQEARLFCYNRYTGRFLHWGSCGGGYYGYRNRPRVYCRNRYSGRFIHWGAC